MSAKSVKAECSNARI